ncbi:MAG: methyltransferase domain-containing protein [Anaerolineae bacterium]
MQRTKLDIYACPACRKPLWVLDGQGEDIRKGQLLCSGCTRRYEINQGIPQFISRANLAGLNKRFAGLYDLFSLVYPAYSRIAFRFIGLSEAQARGELVERLEPRGGRVLEVSAGPGSNLPYLFNRTDAGEVYALDISPGQLARCRRLAARRGWPVELALANAERLPYRDESFDAVLHMGGINFFNDKQAAIAEMVRVARPGARIVISDETERGARGYEVTLPFFKGSFGGKRDAVEPPVNLVPPGMQDVTVTDTWKGWFYRLEFRKPL